MKIPYSNFSHLKLLSIFIKLFNYISHTQSKPYNDILLIWRQRIFTTFFLSAIVVAAFTYIQNMKIALQSGESLHLTIYTAFYSLAIIITLVRIIPFKFRACVGLLLLYGLGLMSLFTAGPVGSGRIWLFSFAVLACLLLGLKAGFVALILNVCTFSFFTWSLNAGYIDTFQLSDYATEYWIANYFSFLFANTVITVSLGVFVSGLEKNLRKEQQLSKELKSSYNKLEQEYIERKLTQIAIIYTLAYLIVLAYYSVQWIPFKVRAWAGLSLFFGVGLTSLIALGPVGSGRMLLFSFAMLASLLLGLRAGILALAY